ncbi:MAG: alginate lyase family protein [Clostridia bacterium]
MKNLVFIGDIEKYQNEIKTTRAKQYKRLLTEADRYKSFDLPKTHPNGSTTYMGIAIVNLALAYRLSGEKRYLDQAKRFINTVLGYEKWGFAHLVNVDLSASWILFGLSLGFDWLKDYLNEDEKIQIENKIAYHAKIIYDYKIKTAGTDWSTAYFQNHNWINLNGLATAGYVLNEEKYTQMAKENFARVFDYMPEDGSNYEGVVYWRYGGMWLFVYAHLLKTEEGIDYFKTSQYLKNTFYFRLYQSSPDLSQQLNFGDCHDRHSGHCPCVYYKVASEYNDGYAQTYANYVLDNFLEIEAENSKVKPGILPEACFEFLWYNPIVKEKQLSDLPKTRYFEDLGLLSIRNSWKANAKVFSIKCGAPGGKKQWKKGWELFNNENIDCLNLAHHHPDNLSYIYANGEDYLTQEDGYNRNILPDNHNVLLVDGEYSDIKNVSDVYVDSAKERLKNNPTYDIVNNYTAEVKCFKQENDIVYYEAETSKIYPDNFEMTEVSRSVFTDNLEFMLFIDRFKSEKEHNYSILNNTCEEAKKVDNSIFRYTLNGENLKYIVLSNNTINSEQYQQTVTAVMTTQEPDKVCKSEIKTLKFETVNKCKEAVFFELFLSSGLEVNYKDYKFTITGKKKYSIITKEAFSRYNIDSDKNIYIIVEENNETTIYNW